VRATDPFWVDLYIDPVPVPTGVNQTCETLESQGTVWGVEGEILPLAPGDLITLTMGDAYHYPSFCEFPSSLPAGTPIYVQVDSADFHTTYGAVLENHEILGGIYNNISGPVSSALGAMSAELAAEPPVKGGRRPSSSHRLPPRP
jgi:hypothetical protein